MLLKGIIWVTFGFLLTLLPLAVVALMAWTPDTGAAGFLRTISNEELLAVAFTLGGAASVDVLANSNSQKRWLRVLKVTSGCCTLLLTFVGAFGFIMLKAHLLHLSPEHGTMAIQGTYGFTVVGSLLCELLSEA